MNLNDDVQDYYKLDIDPIFDPIKKLFEFFLLGIGFVCMPTFQNAFLTAHPEIEPLLNAYNEEVGMKSDGHMYTASAGIYYTSIGRIMAVSISDFLEASTYRNRFQNTEIYRFVRHIRNGSAHGNRFNFKEQDLVGKPALWRDKIIDKSLIGKPVIPGFMNPITMLYLMSDITNMIKSYKV